MVTQAQLVQSAQAALENVMGASMGRDHIRPVLQTPHWLPISVCSHLKALVITLDSTWTGMWVHTRVETGFPGMSRIGY